MVDLSLFTDWSYCSACGLPAGQKPENDLELLRQFKDAVEKHNGNAVAAARARPQFERFLDPCQLAELARTRPPKPPAKLMACADCSCVAYHNLSCQKSHWKSCHKRECKDLAKAILPLKELIRWHKMHKRVKKNNLKTGEELNDEIGDTGGGKLVWCWWEPDNENGITEETLGVSDATWRRSGVKWQNGEYLDAMGGFQSSLEPYRIAWPYICKSSGSNERREDNLHDFFKRSFCLAKRLLFCAYCELDASQVDSARQRLVQCISITMTIFFTAPSRAAKTSVHNVMNDAWMELMLSMEEIPQHRIIARHVAALAIATKSCHWTDPLQRPGYMAPVGLPSIPYCSPENHPSWCIVIEDNWNRILDEYNTLVGNPMNFSDVGSGERGSGHDDHTVVSGRSWKEYVLFGTGCNKDDNDAPVTKQLLRSNIPDAVSLAEQGGGEVIFSRLAPRTHIKPHCGPTNLRWTAHLGLVIPDSSSDCQIRVRDEWYSWSPGKILLFDDSFEHEVKNDTDETRVVLLIRFWHPQLPKNQQSHCLSEAMMRKEEEVKKRYHPPA